jgi:hypothetical protein
MKTQNRQFDKNRGSALILVVVVTVLLAVVGVMFLMISRAGETQSGAVVQSKDLNAAVETVVNRINEVLVDDLFGRKLDVNPARWTRDEVMVNGGTAPMDKSMIYSDEPWDAPGYTGESIHPVPNGAIDKTTLAANNDDVWMPGQMDDFWLASLEPVYVGPGPKDDTIADDEYVWPHITDLWGQLQGTTDSFYYQQFGTNDHIYYQNTRKRWIDPDRLTNPDGTSCATHADDGWHTSGLWDKWQVSARNVKTKIIKPKDRMDIIAVNVNNSGTYPSKWEDATHVSPFGARADADGDGVADSRWVQIPGLSTSRGEPVFAAVRIIDNCGMLNLNGAYCFYQEPANQPTRYKDSSGKAVSPFLRPWFYNLADYTANTPYHNNEQGAGRYLTEINYLPFLRGNDNFGTGGDGWYRMMDARGFYDTVANAYHWPQKIHQYFMTVETPSQNYSFFDIGDELELRNRCMVTSPAEARFERKDVANFSLDAGGGTYGCLRTPVDDNGALANWYIRVNPNNFDKWDRSSGFIYNPVNANEFKYDRRHISTFYSFDRTLRNGQPPLSYDQLRTDGWSRQQIAATKQSIFWYPQLYSELKTAGWNPQQVVNAQRLFWPVGPVTTDIASPEELLKGTSGRPYNNLETRRRILHLLFAFREYFYQQNGNDLNKAALSAAQVVANLIDFTDDYSVNDDNGGNQDGKVDKQGPFYSPAFSVSGYTIDYGQQANIDCTFLTEQIIQNMIVEISGGTIPVGTLPFGFNATDVVFGYERQPFISEVYARRNPLTGVLQEFAVELLNPYPDDLPLVRADASFSKSEDAWHIRVGNAGTPQAIADIYYFIPAYNNAHQTPGRYVVSHSGSVALGPDGPLSPAVQFAVPALLSVQSTDTIQLLRPAPKWVRDKMTIPYIVVDEVSADRISWLLGNNGQSALKRDDRQWRFAYPEYATQQGGGYTHTLGQPNGVTRSVPKEFQLAVADGGLSPARLHELETLSIQGGGKPNDPNSAITTRIADPNNVAFFDLIGNSAGVLNHVCTMNRPLLGSLPGRININTAPVHVIAAAIPPTLIDPEATAAGTVPPTPVPWSATRLAQLIVNYRNANGPYKKIDDLLDLPVFKKYQTHLTLNAGAESIRNDIEERDWILSNLANKFTVRSDTFTAYILVRLGTDGPQRRMIAIFDRSQVWDMNDRPKLVALHPVPDPR